MGRGHRGEPQVAKRHKGMGYVREKTPEKTMVALEAKLPKKYRVEINRLLVPFGKHVCTGKLPKDELPR